MSDARIYVDGRFVGNYAPDETVLELPVGKRKVRVEVPRAHAMQERPDGTRAVRFFALKGEETIDVLGGESRQTLVFSSENLLAREIHDEDGH